MSQSMCEFEIFLKVYSLFIKFEQRNLISIWPRHMLLLMLSYWNGLRRTSVDSFMLYTVLVILTVPSSMCWGHFFDEFIYIGYAWIFLLCCKLVLGPGFILNVLGWSCWGKETFLKRNTPMPFLVLAQKRLILLWSWHTVSLPRLIILIYLLRINELW